jgi:hypothetical protein
MTVATPCARTSRGTAAASRQHPDRGRMAQTHGTQIRPAPCARAALPQRLAGRHITRPSHPSFASIDDHPPRSSLVALPSRGEVRWEAPPSPPPFGGRAPPPPLAAARDTSPWKLLQGTGVLRSHVITRAVGKGGEGR